MTRVRRNKLDGQKGVFEFSRQIKLAPAIGDWTTIQYRDTDLEEINISHIQNINFDSLAKKDLKQVHYIHYNFAEKLAKKLSLDMNIKVELHSIVATQMAYDDFLKHHTDNVVQSDFLIDNVGRANLIFEWDLADAIVNRLAGGEGKRSATTQFTALEGSLLKAQVNQLIPFFINSWGVIFEPDDLSVEFSCGKYQKDPKISLREAYIMFAFNLYFGDDNLHKVVLAYPNHVLRECVKRRTEFERPIKKTVALEQSTLKKVKIPVKAELGKSTLTMSEIRHLQKGDILPLDTTFKQPLTLHLGTQTQLHVQPGVVNNKVCVQVLLMDQHEIHKKAPAKPELPEEYFISQKTEEVHDSYALAAMTNENADLSESVEHHDRQVPTDKNAQTQILEDEPDWASEDSENDDISSFNMADTVNESDSALQENESDDDFDDDFSWDDLNSEE